MLALRSGEEEFVVDKSGKHLVVCPSGELWYLPESATHPSVLMGAIGMCTAVDDDAEIDDVDDGDDCILSTTTATI